MKKLFVLDTCVLLNDPNSIFCMDEHDVGLAFEVLNELDRIKDSGKVAAYEARQVIRNLYSLLGDLPIEDIRKGVSLGDGLGCLRLLEATSESANLKGDDAIIASLLRIQEDKTYEKVVLVTRDMNMNLRAKLAGVANVEDYLADRVENTEALDDTGFIELDLPLWEYFTNVESVCNGGQNQFTMELKPEFDIKRFIVNRYVESDGRIYRVDSIIERNVSLVEVSERKIFGISPKNIRQIAAFDAVSNPEIGLVTLTGMAGSGKTLIAVAQALESVIEKKEYQQIIIVRNTPPIGEQTGYLPGDEDQKMRPYMGGPLDALTCLGGDNNKVSSEYLIEASSMSFKSCSTMRGASCQNTLLIIEEAQNTSINTIKALITRVGPGSKVIVTGNLNNSQIDASYVTAYSNGLIRTVEVFTGHLKAAHVQLLGSQRGDIAAHAEEYL